MAKKKQEYYRLFEILKTNSQYNIICGERSNGKSYAIKEMVIREALKDPEKSKFMYLRRYQDDIKPVLVSSYLSDMKDFLEKESKGRFNNFKIHNGNIFAEHLDEDYKQTDVLKIGYCRSLNNAERLKSNSYLDVENIVFEEFIATSIYLPMEHMLFDSIISTVARRRKIKVFLIGNTITRNCIYFQHFQLTRVPKQKQGTIEIYDMKTDPIQYDENGEEVSVRIAVEICANKSNNTKMFAGTNQSAITTGTWQVNEQPFIKINKEIHDCIYTVVFKYRLSKFLAQFYCNSKTGDMFWYVTPKTSDLRMNERIISDDIYESNLTTSNLTPLIPQEQMMFNLLLNNKVFFSDNLCGTEFKEAINFFHSNLIYRRV